MDQARKLLAQHLVADAPFVERAGLEILDQHVGVLEHGHQHLAAAGRGEVEPDRALVAVDADEVGGVAVVERRAPFAHFVAGRRLDLDDVGTVIGKQLGAVGPAEDAGQVDHAQSRHGAGTSFGNHDVCPGWLNSAATSIAGTRPRPAAFRHGALQGNASEAGLAKFVRRRGGKFNAPAAERTGGGIGGARRDRTADLLHAMQALSQLSYGPEYRTAGKSVGGAAKP